MKPKKRFGQHFLRDASVIRKIITAAEITPGERVLEIGPGQGVLTEALLNAGAQVTAVEIDRDLIEPLQERFGDRLRLVQGDILHVPLHQLIAEPYQVISNLPYNIASAVLEKCFTQEPHPHRLVVMVQKEVGERLLARPPHARLLSLACQIYTDAARVAVVPRGAFTPPPLVESMVVCMDYAPKTAHPENVLQIAKIAFAHPRKQLAHLFTQKGWSKEEMQSWLEGHGLSKTARPQELAISQWIELAQK